MNKPTIREEWMNKDDVTMGAKFDTQDIKRVIADWWFNKIKEVVGEEIKEEDIPVSFGQYYEKLHNIKIINQERQRILQEFGIIE